MSTDPIAPGTNRTGSAAVLFGRVGLLLVVVGMFLAEFLRQSGGASDFGFYVVLGGLVPAAIALMLGMVGLIGARRTATNSGAGIGLAWGLVAGLLAVSYLWYAATQVSTLPQEIEGATAGVVSSP